MTKTASPSIPASNSDLGSILICAVRYCLGRETYMPHLVIGFIVPLIPHLENRVLSVMTRDIREAPSYGMDCDEKAWMDFLCKLCIEAEKRGMKI